MNTHPSFCCGVAVMSVSGKEGGGEWGVGVVLHAQTPGMCASAAAAAAAAAAADAMISSII